MAGNKELPPPTDAPEVNLNQGGTKSAHAVTQLNPTPSQAQASIPLVMSRNMSKTRQEMVDRFRSDVKEVVKNRSFHADKYDPERVPHRHFFDSIDRKGKKTTRLSPASGHTHNFEYKNDKDGNLDPASFKCGPALIQKTVSKGDGTSTTSFVPNIVFKNKDTEEKTVDDHTHEMVYIKSEHIEIKI